MDKGHFHYQEENPKADHNCAFHVNTGLMTGADLGDSFADVTHFMGADKLTHLYTQLTGLDCGCKTRQINWNKLWPNFR
jgi:hypothetical protein